MYKKEDQNPDTLGSANWYLNLGVLLIILSPIIFFFFDDVAKTGQIGDTLGGVTSPIVNLLGSILIYLALKEQIQANKILQEQIRDQKTKDIKLNQADEINQLYNNLKQSIDNFTYSDINPDNFGVGHYLTGSEAIYKLFDDFYCSYCHWSEEQITSNPKITELKSILEICDVIIKKLNDADIPNKEGLLTLSKHQFKYRILPRMSLEGAKLSKFYCEDCKKEHGLPEDMANLLRGLYQAINFKES